MFTIKGFTFHRQVQLMLDVSDTLFQIISQRHCQRAFLPTEVPRESLSRVLEVAGQAPSSKNTQPWQVAVLRGQVVQQLSAQLCLLFEQGIPQQADYTYFPEPWPTGFLERARACGYGLFELKGIERQDYAARQAHNRENFAFFGAPAYLVFHLPMGAARGNFLDLGFFMQNVMLGLTALGLGSCPQFSVAGYADALRAFLDLPERLMVAGMAVGYPDKAARVNTYVPERLPLESYVQWYESV